MPSDCPVRCLLVGVGLLIALVGCGKLSVEQSDFRKAADQACRALGGEPDWNMAMQRAGCDFYYRPTEDPDAQ